MLSFICLFILSGGLTMFCFSSVPVSIYILSLPLPYIPQGASLNTSFIIGTAILVLGLLLYNLPQPATQFSKSD